MRINEADVAELVDARDLKFLAGTENIELSDLTPASTPIEIDRDPPVLSNKRTPLAAPSLGRSHTQNIVNGGLR